MGARTWCRSLAICAFVLGLAAIAAPSYAQTGQVKGKVTDASGKPVEGAVVTIEGSDSGGRKFTVKTNKSGDYIQIGLQPGQYKLTATKDALTQTVNQRISLDMVEVNFTLKPGGGGGDASAEDRKKAEAKNAAVKTAFSRGRRAQQRRQERRGDCQVHRSARARAEVRGVLLATSARTTRRRRTGPRPRRAYKKAIEIDAELRRRLQRPGQRLQRAEEVRPGGRSQRAGDEAVERRAAAGGAAGGGNASALFNQGVILWNAGKIPDAKKQFEDAVKPDPKLADAHYWLGMANLNEGKPDAARPPCRTSTNTSSWRRPASTPSRPRASSRRSRSKPARCPSPTTRRRPGPDCCRRAAVRARPRQHHPRRRLQDLPVRRRARSCGRRPARLRRESRAGSPAEDRPAGRHSSEMAPDRPSADRTRRGKRRRRSRASTRSTRWNCCGSWTTAAAIAPRGRAARLAGAGRSRGRGHQVRCPARGSRADSPGRLRRPRRRGSSG